MQTTHLEAAIVLTLLIASGHAQAAIFEFVRQLPGRTATGYDFGIAVDTDGVLVAASSLGFDPSPGATGGAGYVFTPENGGLVNRLFDNTTATADAYGLTIAIDGDRTIVGAPRSATQPDTVYLFDHTTGAVLAKPTGDVRSENSFGSSVAMDQGLAIVGSPREFISPTARGAAYLIDTSDGARIRKFTSGSDPSSAFGSSADLDGNIALIGSPDSTGVGAAHLFDLTTGDKLRDLFPSDNPIQDSFGLKVAIADGIAVVGAPSVTGSGSGFGAVYLFDVATGQQTAKLIPSGSLRGDGFGWTIAIDHGIALVGSRFTDTVYAFDARTGAEVQKIIRPDGAYGFGSSLAFRDGLAVIGAQGSRPGSAYIYRLTIPEPSAYLTGLAALTPLALRRR